LLMNELNNKIFTLTGGLRFIQSPLRAILRN
jgi:hypothetical protein